MKIRTAILGYGRNGSSMHAGPVERNDAFEMAAVCDIDAERRKQAEERFGCAVYEEYGEMLEKEELDLVCVVTRSDQHCAMVCDCLSAGVNVLVTKPWAANVAEAERMIACAAASGKLLLPWLPARWGCDLRRLQELMAEGVIGKVFMIRRVVSSFATRCDWQTERRYAGGYVMNWGAHIVDPPALLMNSRVESVYGKMRQTINPGDTEDLFMAIMTLADGTIVQAEYSVSVEEIPNWFIQGDRGTIVVRGRELKIHRSDPGRPNDPTRYATMQAEEDSVVEETLEGAIYGDEHEIYAGVARAIRGEGEVPFSTDDALEVSRILVAIRISNDENRVVALT